MVRPVCSLFAVATLFLTSALASQQPQAPQQSQLPHTIPWRSLGPANNAGRISVVTGVPGNRDVYYVAGANGGIIKTTNGGTTFKPVFDKQPVGSIGAIAVAPSDPNVVYVGTGEGNPRNNASFGDGMYKSVDAGEHWTHVGLDRTDKIARIAIDSRNPESRLRLRAGPRVGAERGSRRVQDHRRRQELEQGAVRRFGHVVLRHLHRSRQLQHRLRRHVHLSPLGLAPRVRRREHGGLEVGGRR